MRAVSGGKFSKDTALFNDDEYLCPDFDIF